MANVLYSIERKLPKLKSKVYSKPLSISGVVSSELSFGKVKKKQVLVQKVDSKDTGITPS